MTPVWWKSAMAGHARPTPRAWQGGRPRPRNGLQASRRPRSHVPRREPQASEVSGRGALAELLEQAQGLGIDLEEDEPDVGGQRVDLGRPRHLTDRHDRVLPEVEGHADGVAELELAAHRLEADAAGREVLA